jgi:hypothetical protein
MRLVVIVGRIFASRKPPLVVSYSSLRNIVLAAIVAIRILGGAAIHDGIYYGLS